MVRAPKLPSLPKFSVRVGRMEGLPRQAETDPSGVPPMPADFPGTEPEWRVFWWLTKHRIEFDYQNPLAGGRTMVGGHLTDFVVYGRTPPLAIEVQGEYWHFGASGLRATDLLKKITYLNAGYEVVFVRERDIMERLDYTMRRALEGVQLYED